MFLDPPVRNVLPVPLLIWETLGNQREKPPSSAQNVHSTNLAEWLRFVPRARVRAPQKSFQIANRDGNSLMKIS